MVSYKVTNKKCLELERRGLLHRQLINLVWHFRLTAEGRALAEKRWQAREKRVPKTGITEERRRRTRIESLAREAMRVKQKDQAQQARQVLRRLRRDVSSDE